MKTPIRIEKYEFYFDVVDADGGLILTDAGSGGEGNVLTHEMARRIVASVNACSTISTGKLEQMATGEVVGGVFGQIASKAMRERDALMAALEEIASLGSLGDYDFRHKIALSAIAKVKGAV